MTRWNLARPAKDHRDMHRPITRMQRRGVIAHSPEPGVPGDGALVGRVNDKRVLIEILFLQHLKSSPHPGVDRGDLAGQISTRLEITS